MGHWRGSCLTYSKFIDHCAFLTWPEDQWEHRNFVSMFEFISMLSSILHKCCRMLQSIQISWNIGTNGLNSKYIMKCFENFNFNVHDIIFMSLLLNLNILYTLIKCFCSWLWTSECLQRRVIHRAVFEKAIHIPKVLFRKCDESIINQKLNI